jgi:lysophospholipase L1-like esterase
LKVPALYGFGKPRDLHRIAPLFVGGLLCTLTLIAAAMFAAMNHLTLGTPRFEYFSYLVGLSLLGTLLAVTPRLAWLVHALCFAELVAGLGSSALAGTRLVSKSLLPVNTPVVSRQFQYHPLLQVVPTPNYSQANPFPIRHDANGIRGPQRMSARLQQQLVIATLGGSSTYDLGVGDGDTWSDVLEAQLGERYAVINHGGPGYSTVENVIQTVFYLNAYGVTPRCAVYYIGWNDIRNAHLPNLDRAYADFHLLSQIDSERVRKTPLIAAFSPLAQSVISVLGRSFDTIPMAVERRGDPPLSGSDERLEEIFRANLTAIVAVNRQRHIASIFVGQVLNRAQLQGEGRYGWLPLVRDTDVWPLQQRFNMILKETADEIGVPQFIPPIEEFEGGDFVDHGHFSVKGATKFAYMVAPIVKAHCR